MRTGFTLGLGVALLLVPMAARADMSAMISGAAPILPAFTTARNWSGAVVSDSSEDLQQDFHDDLQQELPAMPLFDRRLRAAERAAELAPDLQEAILRIEGVYDPTRVEGTGVAFRMRVAAGTASMSNVFGDRWHLGDTDANVSYVVRYIAQAWGKGDGEPCSAYRKRRPTVGIVELTSMGPADCARAASLRGPQDTVWAQLTITAAPVSVPVFAAPEPGARMSPEAFWAAQKVRIEAIRARIAFQRQRPRGTLAAER